MSGAWSNESSCAGPAPELARTIARKLCNDSLAWARTFAVSAPPPHQEAGTAGSNETQLEDDLFVEVLAYGLRLLEMRLAAVGPAYPDGLAAQVRRECSVLVGQAGWRRRTRFKRFPAPDPGLSGSRYAQLYPARNGDRRGQSRLTREMFEQFCHCTGLGSEVLVGTGENLASLVFYIAVHSVRSARGLPTREEVLRLLRAASECRTQMQRAISRWLAAEHPSRPALAAGHPGPGVALAAGAKAPSG